MIISCSPGDCWIDFETEDMYAGRSIKLIGESYSPNIFVFYKYHMQWMIKLDNGRYRKIPVERSDADLLSEYITKKAAENGVELKPVVIEREMNL